MANTIQSSDLDKPKKTGTGFVNLQRVIGANSGSGLGQAVAGQSQQIANNVNNNVQKAGEQFQTKTNEAFKPFQGGEQFGQNAIATPTGLSDADMSRFQTLRQGVYTGPQGLNDEQSLASGVQNVNNLAKMGQTNGGRQALLGTLFQTPQYSSGQRRLDSAILQADPTQSKSLSSLQNVAAKTGRNYANLSGYASNDAGLKQRQAMALGQETSANLGKEVDLRNKEQADKLESIQKNELSSLDKFNALQNAFKRGEISNEDADRLGLTDALAKDSDIYNLDLNNYIKTDVSDLPTSVNQIVSSEDAARQNALAKLGGNGDVYSDMSKVGTFKPSQQTFDLAKFAQDQGSARQAAMPEEEALRGINELLDYNRRGFSGVDANAIKLNAKRAAVLDGPDEGSNDAGYLAGKYAHSESDMVQRQNALRQTLINLGVNPDTIAAKSVKKVDKYS